MKLASSYLPYLTNDIKKITNDIKIVIMLRPLKSDSITSPMNTGIIIDNAMNNRLLNSFLKPRSNLECASVIPFKRKNFMNSGVSNNKCYVYL